MNVFLLNKKRKHRSVPFFVWSYNYFLSIFKICWEMFPIFSCNETVVKTDLNGYNIINMKCWNSCYFEPTFTLNGILILCDGCQAPQFRSGEGRRNFAVTHLARARSQTARASILGILMKKQPIYGCFFHY